MFYKQGFRSRGKVPCAHAKACLSRSLSQGFRIRVKHFSGHAKTPVSKL